MLRQTSPLPARLSSVAVIAAGALCWADAAAGADTIVSRVAPAHARIVDASDLRGVARVSPPPEPSRPGLARPALQVTIRPEPVPGDQTASPRRELIVVFD